MCNEPGKLWYSLFQRSLQNAGFFLYDDKFIIFQENLICKIFENPCSSKGQVRLIDQKMPFSVDKNHSHDKIKTTEHFY